MKVNRTLDADTVTLYIAIKLLKTNSLHVQRFYINIFSYLVSPDTKRFLKGRFELSEKRYQNVTDEEDFMGICEKK